MVLLDTDWVNTCVLCHKHVIWNLARWICEPTWSCYPMNPADSDQVMPICLTKICLILLNIFKCTILSIRALKKELKACLYGKVFNARTDQHPHTKIFQKGWLLSVWAAPLAVTLTFRLRSLSWLNLQWKEATLSGRGFSQHWPRWEGSLLLDWLVFSGMCVCVDVCVWGSWQPL